VDKPVVWLGSSKDDLSAFPKVAKSRAGFELRALQRGERPSSTKPIPEVGRGVEEIRVNVGEAYRVFYVARFEEAIYVLHAFQKKSQKTAKPDLELGQTRYKQMLELRQRRLS
jgi:phage-related protein